MTYRINYIIEMADGHHWEDSFVVSRDTTDDIRNAAMDEMERRGLNMEDNFPWMERIDGVQA